MQGGRAINPAIPHTQHRPAEYMDVGVVSCRWRASGGLLRLPGGRAGLRPGAVVHGTLPAAGVLRRRGGRVAPRPGRSHRVPGGPECPAALPPAPGLQMSAWLTQGGALPQGLLDGEVCRWVGRRCRRASVRLSVCLAPSRVELLTDLRYWNSLSLALFIVLHSRFWRALTKKTHMTSYWDIGRVWNCPLLTM